MQVLYKNGKTVALYHRGRGKALCLLYKNLLQEFINKGGICMMIISLESAFYIVSIIAIFCGAAYKAGYEAGKNAKK